ncbi:MAG: Gfo/Idh/MocA family oxidoreductase [Ruminococcaceae bacterium]|nr:Gfo/Idh/MocA family oxidoreductase [Oscillospiraceae bacterium]
MEENKKHIRIGLLGFGSMGRTHTWAVKNLPFFYGAPPFSAITAGIVTTSFEKSQRVAEQFGIERAYTSEDELINDPSIDVIDICTPNCHHFETLKKAIVAGKHVLCEKPLCTTPREAELIAAIPRREGQITGMVFNNRWMAPVLRAKQLIDEGRIGRVLTFCGAYLHSSATDTARRAGWKQDRTVCGGGVLFDLGSHIIDLLGYLVGPMCEVSGMSQIAYPVRTGRNGDAWETNADESFYLMGRTADGACGTVTVGKLQVGANDDLSFEIYGEKGALRFSLMEPNWLYFYDNTRPDAPIGGERGFVRLECIGRYPDLVFPSVKAPAGWLYGHLASMHAFLSAVSSGKEFFPSLSDGLYVQRVMDAAYRSDENNGMRTEVTPC